MLVQIFNDPVIYSHLIDVAVPLLAAGLGYVGKLLVAYIQSHVHNAMLQSILIRLNDAVITAVKSTNQLVANAVRDASADGVITPAERDHIKQVALDSVKSYLGLKGLNEVGKVLGLDQPAVDKLVGDKIEAAVADVKKNL